MLRKLSIDRFEGKYAFCEDDNQKMYAIDISDLPSEAKEGNVIIISDEGKIDIDIEETKKRQEKIKKIQNKLWKD